jgi:CheY-like chemotaxis protein
MTDQHGSIHVKLQRADVDGSELIGAPALPVGQYVRLILSDDGCGMDAATLERIFDPFFTTKPAGSGSGLGLSVVRGIVSSHRGAITAYSRPGTGTTFSIYLPVAREYPTDRSLATDAASASGSQRILYVDDEIGIVQVATQLLERAGYRVTAFTDPRAALEALLTSPQAFDVVVTDFSMPGMNGIELAERIRAVRQDLPVIVTTGYITETERAHALAIGCRAVISKPASISELRGALAGIHREVPPSPFVARAGLSSVP